MARKPKPFIPQSPDELSADWFSSNLDVNSSGASVVSVETEMIGGGIGFVGDVFRCRLGWDTDSPDLPQSVVVKVPSSLRSNRLFGEGIMAYERELDVYRSLAHELGAPMPSSFHTDMDPNPAPWVSEVVRWLLERLPLGGVNWLVDRLLSLPDSVLRRFILVLEDIDDARPTSQFEGGTVDDALAALEVLAAFHATNWMNQSVLDEHRLIWPVDRTPKVFQASYRRNRDAFVERFGSAFDASAIERLDAVQDQVPELASRMVEPPWTILHGDYRLDNILFRGNGDIVVIDYQLLLWGRPGWDVAYFITTALSPEHRGDEGTMLETYHAALVAGGVTNYSMDDLLSDVSTTKDLLAHRFVGTGDLLDTEVEGQDHTLIELMARRTIGWITH